MDKRFDRTIVLVDMDAFYCQVEEQLNPALKGRPSAVVQFNAWQGGGIIAANYLARAKGVTRHMRADEAKKICEDIELITVNSIHGKADLSKYRDAGQKVAEVITRFQGVLERASIDEAYMDISIMVNQRIKAINSGTYVLPPQQLEYTYVPGYDNFGSYAADILTEYMKYDFENKPPTALDLSNLRLLVGASFANEIRAAIKRETGYECSAGIAHNKILAKLACGLNKPNKQTILPLTKISTLFNKLPVRKLRGLGGKFGKDVCCRCNVTNIGDLRKYTLLELQQLYDVKYGSWLYNLCRGIDFETVKHRSNSQSISCCKKFPGRNKLTDIDALQHWLLQLSTEIEKRLERDIAINNRRPNHILVTMIFEIDKKNISSSRSRILTSCQAEDIAKCCLDIIKQNMVPFLRPNSHKYLTYAIKYLGISTGKFISNSSANSIKTMFNNQVAKDKTETIVSIKNLHHKFIENATIYNQLGDKISDKPCTSNNVKERESFFLQTLKKIEDNTKIRHNSSVVKFKNTNICSRKGRGSQNYLLFQNNRGTLKNFLVGNIEEKKNQDLSTGHSTNNGLTQNESSHLEHFHNFKCSKSKNDSIEIEMVRDNEDKLLSIGEATKTQNDYRSQYIEFSLPNFNPPLLKYIKCAVCGKEILDDEVTIRTHKDYHFALELSTQEREEYKKQVKIKTNGSSYNNLGAIKKIKLSNSKDLKNMQITKFFQKQNIIHK